jgi:tRNA threonylcarbamoyladenosine biosynthesis protein TsaB
MLDRVTRLLALDTATALCSVVVCEGDRVLALRCEHLGRGHAERLMPMVEETMAEAGFGYAALDAFAVTVGPGAFTGVRVGLAAARGLALATGRPLIGVTTLEALAAAGPQGATIAAALLSGRDRVYLQVFAPGAVPLGPPEAPTIAEAAARIPAGAVLVGDAATRIAAHRGHTVDPTVLLPDIAVVARLALRRLAAGEVPDRPPAPVYVRPPDARPMAGRAR